MESIVGHFLSSAVLQVFVLHMRVILVHRVKNLSLLPCCSVSILSLPVVSVWLSVAWCVRLCSYRKSSTDLGLLFKVQQCFHTL